MSKTVSLLLMTYNCREHLERTLRSIENQDYDNIEICIQDSCSTDGTVDVIKNYEAVTSHRLVWRSEKDEGLYDGLNRAIALSTGDYLQVMNDEFATADALSSLVKALEDNMGAVGAHGDLEYIDDGTGKVIRYWRMGEGTIRQGWCPAHPTLLLKREVYESYGVYDTSYESASDYEFMVRVLKDRKNKLAYVPRVVVAMFAGGTSNEGVYNYWRSIRESLRGLRVNRVPFGLTITLLRTLRVCRQFCTRRRIED